MIKRHLASLGLGTLKPQDVNYNTTFYQSEVKLNLHCFCSTLGKFSLRSISQTNCDIPSTSKWKERVPDCIPLSSCLIDSSSVTTRSDGPGECDCSDWSLNVRAEGNCNKGATRPGPVIQGQFKDAINIHAAELSSHCTSSRCGTSYLSPFDTR